MLAVMNIRFDHEMLDVYRASIAFVLVIDEIAKDLPRGRAYLNDQLQRAGSSITLNIAEGAGEFSPNEKKLGSTEWPNARPLSVLA